MGYFDHNYKMFLVSGCTTVPAAYSNSAPRVPNALWTYRQFVVWKLEDTGRPKLAKVPYDPKTGSRASSTDPATWGDYSDALEALKSGQYSGIGFVFTPNDPFVFLDFDDCKDEAGNWLDGSGQWYLFKDSAWEYSQSGNGIHVIVSVKNKAFLADHMNKWRRHDGGMNECYASERFVAFGPTGWTGEPQPFDSMLQIFVPSRQASGAVPAVDWETAKDEASPGYDGPAEDDELIRRALESRGGAPSMFGKSAPFRALWEADAAVLGAIWPDAGGARVFDHSSADMALMNALAWWTGCNPVRMWRLFQRSKLYRPEKARTAAKALEKAVASKTATGGYLKSREHRLKEAATIGEDVGSIATPVMTLNEMTEKLVLIRRGKGVVHRDRKMPFKWDEAKTDYAASEHTFETGQIDKDGNPKTKTVECLEAWRKLPNTYAVNELTWQPGEPEFCNTLDGSGEAYNTYVPLKMGEPPLNWKDWAKPFIDHLTYLVPVEAERNRFMQWLAHIVQKPHELPHTCYLFFTPTHGVGRGTFAEILARVFRGYAAIGVAPEMLIGNGFNGRLSRKLFATIDEVREGTRSAHSREAQIFKSRITETEKDINPKFGLQSVEKNCTRWLFFSQYEDAIPFDNNDRRVIVIANPTVAANSEWFSYLHEMLHQREFIASVQHYLATLDLTGFNPGAHAGMNDAKRRALKAMESPALQAARQFAATWPGALAAVSDLRSFVGDDDWPKHSSAARSMVEAAGMIPAGLRLKVSGVVERVVIVRPDLIPADALPLMPATDIASSIIKARTTPM